MLKNFNNYQNVPTHEWSRSLIIDWDFDLENPVYNPNEKKEEYYDGDTKFLAGFVNLNEFFTSLPKPTRLKGAGIWKERDSHKLNGVINFWQNNGKMTPILIDTYYNCSNPNYNLEDRIVLRAGWHRFSVCCLVKLDEIPFFTPKTSKKDIETKLKTVRWIKRPLISKTEETESVPALDKTRE